MLHINVEKPRNIRIRKRHTPPARPPPSCHLPPRSTDRDWIKLALARSRETKFLLSSLRDAQGDQYLPPEGVEGEEGMPDTGAVQVMRAWNPVAVSKTASIADTGKTAKTSPKIPPAPGVVGKKEGDTSDNAHTNGTTPPTRSAGSGSPLVGGGGGARGRSRIRSTVPPLRIMPAVAAPPPLIDVHARLQGSLISTSQPRLLEVTPSGVGEVGSFGGGGKGGARPSSRQVEPSAVERLGGHYSPAAQGLFVDPNRGSVAWRQRGAIHYADDGGSGGGNDNVGGDRCLLSSRGAHCSPWRGEDRSRPGVRTEVDRRVVSSSAVTAGVSGREEEGARLSRLARLAPRATSAPGTKRCSRIIFSDDGDDRNRPGTTTTTVTVERFAGVDDTSSANRVRGRGTGISGTNPVPEEGGYSPQTISGSTQGGAPDTEIRRYLQGEEQEKQAEENEEGGNNNDWIEGKRSAAPWITEQRGVAETISLESSLSKMRVPLDDTEQATPRHPSPALHHGNDDHQSPMTPAAGERWRLPSDESPRVAASGRSCARETDTGGLGSESDDIDGRRYHSSSIIATMAITRGADDAVAGGGDERLEPGSERCGDLQAWWMTCAILPVPFLVFPATRIMYLRLVGTLQTKALFAASGNAQLFTALKTARHHAIVPSQGEGPPLPLHTATAMHDILLPSICKQFRLTSSY